MWFCWWKQYHTCHTAREYKMCGLDSRLSLYIYILFRTRVGYRLSRDNIYSLYRPICKVDRISKGIYIAYCTMLFRKWRPSLFASAPHGCLNKSDEGTARRHQLNQFCHQVLKIWLQRGSNFCNSTLHHCMKMNETIYSFKRDGKA